MTMKTHLLNERKFSNALFSVYINFLSHKQLTFIIQIFTQKQIVIHCARIVTCVTEGQIKRE